MLSRLRGFVRRIRAGRRRARPGPTRCWHRMPSGHARAPLLTTTTGLATLATPAAASPAACSPPRRVGRGALGRLQQRSWTAEDGSARSTVEVVAEELGLSLRWVTATTTRAPRS
jgi:hypothetical protein